MRILVVLLLGLLAAACTPMGNLVAPRSSVTEAHRLNGDELAKLAKAPTRIYPGDTLRIVRDAQDAALDLRNLVEDSQTQLYVVRPDGTFSYRFAGRVEAAGKTPDELAQAMRDKLSAVYREPGVTINIVSSPSSKVVVGGAVRTPGAVDMSAVATLQQGLFAAGGMLPAADASHIALLRLDDQQRYRLYFLDLSRMLDPSAPSATTVAFQRGDILFVPKSTAGNMGDGVEVYINQLLPFTRSLGVSYSYGDTVVHQ